MYVVERLIDAAANLDYPRDRLEIQVLDDSTDKTSMIVARSVKRWALRGISIVQLHRKERVGFKAGALEQGLRRASGELVAIFDADFVPTSDFLKRVVPEFKDARVGMVQARWGHINDTYSLLTRVQAIFLDAHFVLEHGARYFGKCFFNFNGTAGMWRRSAIEQSGGWQHDTLTEDLDLSYRSQLEGWKFVFLQDLVVPAEIPVEMNAFKVQQYRWAKGSVQTCLKILPSLFQSAIPLRVKIESFFHLTANFNYPLLLILSLLLVPALVVRSPEEIEGVWFVDIIFFYLTTVSMFNFYLNSQKAIRPDWLSRLRCIPLSMAVGIGLSVNNTLAVFDGLFGQTHRFVRTPKYGIMDATDHWADKNYRRSAFCQPLVELTLGIYFTAGVIYAISKGMFVTVPFLAIFQIGFLYVGVISILQQCNLTALNFSPRLRTNQ
tara:strand:- start:9848 stop:11158 length:1311 start_codon:yes stop_codon:yes gene_type:complete